MGLISIAAFKPKPGMEDELLKVIEDRIPLLRSLGMITERKPINMRSSEGVFVHVSEWVDDDAISRAHSNPDVLALWQRFDDCCEFVKLDSLSESHNDFATFTAID
ncbi:MAG: hypothetical protein IH984_05315 [Planctomycetes bacterium]|nr:hypothetical protein [Planctomycetota bacterium]